jgi:hypothetical protein
VTRLLAVAGLGLVAVAGILMLARADFLEAGDDMRALEGEAVAVPDFGPRGSFVLRYQDGEEAAVAFDVRNRGPLPVTVTEVGLPTAAGDHMFQTVGVEVDAEGTAEPFRPFTLRPGEARTVVIRARFGSCAYYTERAVEIHEVHPFRMRVLGLPMSAEVTYPYRIVVRSPTIQNCPDRLMDRGARRRTEPSPAP